MYAHASSEVRLVHSSEASHPFQIPLPSDLHLQQPLRLTMEKEMDFDENLILDD